MLHSIDLIAWVKSLGYLSIVLIIFVETGVFFGFLLPGDSLLFTIGLLSAQGVFNIAVVIPSIILAAFLGYVFGYWCGKQLGRSLLRRPDSFWFKKKYIVAAISFYLKHAGQAVVWGRLLPFVRTFVPIVAGMAKMPYLRYSLFNMVGAMIWGASIPLLGYYFGHLAAHIHEYMVPGLLLLLFIGFVVTLMLKLKKHRGSHS